MLFRIYHGADSCNFINKSYVNQSHCVTHLDISNGDLHMLMEF